MELNELRESVRRELLQDDMAILDMLSCLHNLLQCIEHKQWERLPKKHDVTQCAYNKLVEKLNRRFTPTQDSIIELEEIY